VLTAAHCLWNPFTQDWWPVSSLHFVAAHQGDDITLHSAVVNATMSDLFRHTPPLPVSQTATDWAVLELAEPLGRQAGWLTVAQTAGKDGLLGHVGYRAEHGHALTLDYGCHLGPFQDEMRVLRDDCEEAHGDSGGPILLFLGDGPHIIGITVMVAKGPGIAFTDSASIVAMGDVAHFPQASRRITEILAKTPNGSPPQEGDAVRRTPDETLAALGRKPGEKSDMAALMRHLTSSAAATP
jgi:protease YdgD